MAGHEVDALPWLPSEVTVDIWTADEALGERSHRAPVPLHEPAHIVAVWPVPLPPAGTDKAPYLIETGRIPCLRNQFGAGEDGIRLDIPDNRGSLERPTRFVS